jgi:hypothetical protein
MRQVLTWELEAPVVEVPGGARHTALLGGGLSLVPLLAALGLALPLPSQAYRLAELVIDRTVALAGALPGRSEREPAVPARPRIDRTATTTAQAAPTRTERPVGVRRGHTISPPVMPATHTRSAAPVTPRRESPRAHVREEPAAAEAATSAARTDGTAASSAPAATATPAAPTPPAATIAPTPAPVANDPPAPAPTPTPAPVADPKPTPVSVTAAVSAAADPVVPALSESPVAVSAKASITVGPVSANLGVSLGTKR